MPHQHEFKRQVLMGEEVKLHREDMENAIRNLDKQWEQIDARNDPLTETQRAAVDSVFSKAFTNVWGPPGVGKTLLVKYIASRFVCDTTRISRPFMAMAKPPLASL